MSSISSALWEGLAEPWLVVDKCNRVANKVLYQRHYDEPFNVMDADWDNLIILDGCRYDIFEEVNNVRGELRSITSVGSHSTEFIENTFVEGRFHDTVYVTANPHAPRLINDEFFKMVTFYEADRSGPPRDHYPENVVKMALNTFDTYPDKKYIIHLMQPNVPFLGPTADEVRKDLLEEHGIVFTGINDTAENRQHSRAFSTLKEACNAGYITREVLFRAYHENVEIALSHAEKLLDEIGGKTAITADHGEMLGERLPPLFFRQFGHDPHVYTDKLRKVPWFVPDFRDRRETTADPPVDRDEMVDDAVAERLERLGYAEYV